jgi:hypothetical protein
VAARWGTPARRIGFLLLVIDEVLTQQHGVGLGVDVRGERDRVGAVVDEDDLPRAAYTIARGRDGDEPGPHRLADAFDGGEPRVALGVARRDLIRRDRNAGVGGGRRGDVHDGVSSHADGESPSCPAGSSPNRCRNNTARPAPSGAL